MSHILVVDDRQSIRDIIKEVLSTDHRITEAGDGEEAIEILTEYGEEIDLIILDVNMPITDGWETLRIIRDEDNGWPNLNVIMLSVQREPESVLKAWNIGATYYCSKPFSICQLTEVVNKALVAPTAA